MFETSFTFASATPLPPNFTIEAAIAILHDFNVVVRLSPDCRGCKRISPPDTRAAKNGAYATRTSAQAQQQTLNGERQGAGSGKGRQEEEMQYYEVEDDLPFIPKRLWSGGVKYIADFLPVEDGCDITVHAPAGFTSTNHWRLVREAMPERLDSTEDAQTAMARVASKDLDHVETDGIGWYVQIVSDARCSKTFAGFVKGFLKNSHTQLQRAFIQRLKESSIRRRPSLGRRRSSVF